MLITYNSCLTLLNPLSFHSGSGVTYLPKLDRPHLQRLAFPRTGFRTDGVTDLGSLVNLKNVPLWAIFLAVIPGSLLASMIFVDHNAASILIQVILPHPYFIFYFLQAEVTTIGFNFL
jgi:hypothetical protein